MPQVQALITLPPELSIALQQMSEGLRDPERPITARGLALATMFAHLIAFAECRRDENQIFIDLEHFVQEIFIPEVNSEFKH